MVATSLLIACVSVQAAARAATLPEIQAPTARVPDVQAPSGQAPAVSLPRNPLPPADPVANPSQRAADPQLGPVRAPASPALPEARQTSNLLADPAVRRDLDLLRRQAQPRSGFGSTNAAANAAWTLGLIDLHGGAGPRSTASAQMWFERATRFGRQPLANAGLAWCALDGCAGPPDTSAARQAINKLRAHHRARALYLEWVLESRAQPLAVRSSDPQGVTSLRLPLRQMLERAAAEGDTQAHIELGLEAIVNGDLRSARQHLQAAAPHSRAAAANLKLLDLKDARPASAAATEADRLLERAQRAHRGVVVPANYAEAMRLYQAAAAQGSAAAKRMLALITSRPQPDGTINIAWMSQLAWLDTANNLPQLDTRSLSTMMYRDPTPLFDLLPDEWQRRLNTVPR
ncbi:hypothetical protein H0I39_18790 [Ottowia beijingensis]|uniref:Sel1 repeat family protein n=2 Tax=Ottowia beijingensis TaxID=1207057 RepID=A0A853IZC0_9BURK|nr:hypothetical protein [Ottowia beijingensis]NZA03254.1 hypothetical protein [Ottowia beijingensis]